jgi:hypothetical protein
MLLLSERWVSVFFWGYAEPPKVHESLTLIHVNRTFYTIDNINRCSVFNNSRQPALYNNVHVSQRRIRNGGRFRSETISLCVVAWHHIYFIFAHDLARLFPFFVLGYRRVRNILILTEHFQFRPCHVSFYHVS